MNKIQVIAHRGNFLPEGPIPEVQNKYTIAENTLEAFKRAFDSGWAVETDVRIWGDGTFVLIHDADTNSHFKIPTLDELCKLAKNYIKDGKGPIIAFQLKRTGNNGITIGREIAKKIEEYGLKNSFLFDTTLDEAKILHEEFPDLNLSVSVGEKNYSPTIYTFEEILKEDFRNTYRSVWADEWKEPGSIYNKQIFNEFRNAYEGRFDVISPELHYNDNHPLAKDLDKLKKLWEEIISWEIVDGICTDHPSQLQLLT